MTEYDAAAAHYNFVKSQTNDKAQIKAAWDAMQKARMNVKPGGGSPVTRLNNALAPKRPKDLFDK